MVGVKPALTGVDEIHLWLTNPALISDQSLLERYLQLLPQDELASYESLANADHRREYLISQAFLRDALDCYINEGTTALQFERNASGKPSLRSTGGDQRADLQFNLAHSAGLMACTVTRAGAVGVDVEAFASDNRMLGEADNYFSPSELQSLEDMDETEQERQFSKIWTLKEAYIKARGEGLALALDSFSFECAEPGPIRLLEGGHYRDDWQFWSLQPIPGYIIAIAAQAANCRLRVFSSVPLCDVTEISLTTLGQVA